MKTFFKKLSIPAIVAVFSIVGTLLSQQFLLAKAKPSLKREIVRTDLSGLSPEVKKQIGLVPINYSVQNISRSTAQNVSIFAKSDSALAIADLKFSQESEDHQISAPDPRELKITAASIRPNGVVSFQILTSASNTINFSELSDNADIITSKAEAEKQTGNKSFLAWGIGTFFVLIYLPVVSGLIYLFWQIGKSWRNLETSTTPAEIRTKLIVVLVALYIYNDLIIGSTAVLQAWLPLPRINFEELTSMFILYLVATRYKLVEEWLKIKIEAGKSQSVPPTKTNP
jgi:hypothetical protein